MRVLHAAVLTLLAAATPVFADDQPLPLKVAVHIHSTVSTGTFTPGAIRDLAQRAGLDGLVFTDSVRRHWEYGFWPLRSVLKWTVEQPSVLAFGAEQYIATIQRLNQDAGSPLALPGLEAAPFYYWHRSPLDRRGGQLRAMNQHLLIFGLTDPGVIRRLPLDAYDPYHGDQGAKPYQQLIEYVRLNGGLVFWAHPAAPERVERFGPAEAVVEPYPHLLELTTQYHGLALADLTSVVLAEPGGVWDQLLSEYCRGRRAPPPWLIGELDWRTPNLRPIDQIVTMIASARTEQGILGALRDGRMWVVYRFGPHPAPSLSRFTITDQASGRTADMGQSLRATGPIRIEFSGRREVTEQSATILLIRNGQLIDRQESAGAELQAAWTMPAPANGLSYYRIIVQDPAGFLWTNPVFVRVAGLK